MDLELITSIDKKIINDLIYDSEIYMDGCFLAKMQYFKVVTKYLDELKEENDDDLTEKFKDMVDPVTLQIMKDPKYLECGHRFSLSTIYEVEIRNHFKCPLCRFISKTWFDKKDEIEIFKKERREKERERAEMAERAERERAEMTERIQRQIERADRERIQRQIERADRERSKRILREREREREREERDQRERNRINETMNDLKIYNISIEVKHNENFTTLKLLSNVTKENMNELIEEHLSTLINIKEINIEFNYGHVPFGQTSGLFKRQEKIKINRNDKFGFKKETYHYSIYKL